MSEKNSIADTILFLSLSCRGCFYYTLFDHFPNEVSNVCNATAHSQIKSHLINSVLFGPLLPLIFHPSFGLSVVLGTQRKAVDWGWSGVRETVKRLLNYSLLSVESAE